MQPHSHRCRFMAQTAQRDRRGSGAPAADPDSEQPPQKPLDEMSDMCGPLLLQIGTAPALCVAAHDVRLVTGSAKP